MAQQSTNLVRVTFAVDGLKDELFVLRITGQEGLSVLYSFELELAAESNSISLDKVVGAQALVTIMGSGGTRQIHGIIADFQQRETQRFCTIYQATLVPAVWRLLQRQDCRIFQKQDALAIVSSILKKANIDHKFQTKGNKKLAKRDYCVQYRESDWAFISRLLEEEGLYYYFKHIRSKHVLHMADAPDFPPDISGDGKLAFHPPDAMVPDEEQIFGFYMRQRLCSTDVALDDFNFLKPSLKMQAKSKAGGQTGYEIYDYPGLYEVPENGKRLAGVRLQEARATHKLGEGRSNCPRLTAGFLFTMDGHGRKDLDHKKYLLTSVIHHLEKSGQDLEAGALNPRCSYDNAFGCIPADVPFRPPRITPRPVVRGAQTAIVVGPASEEIYTDEYGRVKVQFHWDRLGKNDADSSCWVRVSQLWAGQSWGAIWIPRIGHEVIVDFLEGDPDRPIVTGRVYHAQNPPPYVLPAEKTKSTIKSNTSPGGGGFNEIRFEDRKGAEEVFTHAQKDQNEVVRHDMTTRVGNDQTLTVGHDRDKTVKNDETSTIVGHRTESVGQDETISITGHRAEAVGKNESVTVSGNRVVSVVQAQAVQVLMAQTLTVGAAAAETIGLAKALTIGKQYQVRVGDSFSEKVAKEKRVEIGEKLQIVCGKSRIILDKSGKVTIEGTDISFKSTGPVTTKGKALKMTGSTLNIKTSGVIKMRGSKIAKN